MEPNKKSLSAIRAAMHFLMQECFLSFGFKTVKQNVCLDVCLDTYLQLVQFCIFSAEDGPVLFWSFVLVFCFDAHWSQRFVVMC